MANPSHEPGRRPAAAPLPPESFHPFLANEIERARRYYRAFGLLRVWPRGARLLEAIPGIVRRADLVAAAPDDGVYILLPETPASGIAPVIGRLEETLARESGSAGPVRAPVLITHAAYPRDGETVSELLGALEGGSS